MEKEMATHSSVLAWRIPGTGEPGGLLSMGSHRVRHDWSDLAAALWDSKCLYCSKNGKGWISKNEFVKCNNQVDVLSLSLTLSLSSSFSKVQNHSTYLRSAQWFYLGKYPSTMFSPSDPCKIEFPTPTSRVSMWPRLHWSENLPDLCD